MLRRFALLMLPVLVGSAAWAADVASRGSTDGAGIDVRCSSGGIVVERDVVTASADGVHLRVDNATGEEMLLVASPVQENPTVRVAPGRSMVVVLAVPGEVSMRCEPPRPDPPHRQATVRVEDSGGFYRSVDVAAELGCSPDTTVDLHDAAWGRTARAATDAYAAGLGDDVMVSPGNGYRDHDRKEFLVHVDGTGTGTLAVYPDRDPDGRMRYRASYDRVCHDRAFPVRVQDAKPLATYSETNGNGCPGTSVDLTDPNYPAAAAGDNGYGYHKVGERDLDGDGVVEAVHVIAHADRGESGYFWDDGQAWHVYVEEPSGERTYLYSGWVQLGSLEVGFIWRDHDITDLLISYKGGAAYNLYCAEYRGPRKVGTTDVVNFGMAGYVAADG